MDVNSNCGDCSDGSLAISKQFTVALGTTGGGDPHQHALVRHVGCLGDASAALTISGAGGGLPRAHCTLKLETRCRRGRGGRRDDSQSA